MIVQLLEKTQTNLQPAVDNQGHDEIGKMMISSFDPNKGNSEAHNLPLGGSSKAAADLAW